jgi:hypothetical protein
MTNEIKCDFCGIGFSGSKNQRFCSSRCRYLMWNDNRRRWAGKRSVAEKIDKVERSLRAKGIIL